MSTIGEAYFDIDIGYYLRDCRLRAGWSQSQVAELLGISFQQVQKYEKGVNRLPANRYPKLSQAIGFDPSQLLLGRVEKQNDILMLLAKANSDERDAIINYARHLIGGSENAADAKEI